MNRLLLLSLALAAPAFAASVPESPSEVRPLLIGAAAPDASLRGLDGKAVTLKKRLAGKPTVLVFYRGGWCPYCNLHLKELKDIQKDLEALGYQTLAVTPDRPSELRKTLDKHALPYTLLSDSKMDAARAFGLAFRVDDKTIKKYEGYGIDLEKSSGEKHHWLPVPGLFIVDKSGVITFVYANPDYKIRLRGPVVLSAAKAALKP
ncbi:MAG: antioxidant AhpC [Elusimicrobia bacterium CG11_big_fil_rev_8_21_14_0_20_64_6]|nr:MAG: antioxidant AhpC [Elusimicrobia bacterium CG11_big_fil_rev_8_21_14_0_20_64_6]